MNVDPAGDRAPGYAPTAPRPPATFAFDPPERVANWRPLVHWLLAIPHLAILYALNVVSEVLSVLSWFWILFTGALPAGIADFQSMILRYSLRTWTYVLFMREEYPPFALTPSAADTGEDARLRVDFSPQLDGRNRLTTAFRIILVIPHLVVLGFLAIGAFFVIVVAFFAVLFTGRWPDGARRYVLGVAMWSLRVQSYLVMLHDEYPPFSLDSSGAGR